MAISKKKLLVGVGVVLLLAAAAGAGVLFQWFQAKNNPPAPAAQQKLPDAVSAAQDLYATGKTDEANKKLNDALNNPSTSNDEKYLLYFSQANFANDQKNYQGAIDAWLKADAIKQTYKVAGSIGAAYQQIGNNTKAIEYYKLAIQRNPADNPLHDRENDMYTEMIRNLGGQP